MIASWHAALLYGWAGLSLGVTLAAITIFLCGADDALLDLLYWALRLTDRTRFPPPALLLRKTEQRAAILIPAWLESGVIAAMLQRLCATQDYGNYAVFVGTYANDPDTAAQVLRAAARFDVIRHVVVREPGPTSKADCLNQLVAAAMAEEEAAQMPFAFLVFHDAEDVVHPLSLKTMNWFMEYSEMIQLPVFSLDRGWSEFVACTYMDEFAEWHSKDMIVRSRLSHAVPSAGVATAFRRSAIALLQAHGEVFNPASLTEDYEVAQRLHALGRESRFVRMPLPGSTWPRDYVSTREFFPDSFDTSVRQKARWMLGIAFLGWRKIGWYGGFWTRYFLMRDRKALISAPAVMFAYVLVAVYLFGAALVVLVPALGPLPPLVRQDWVRLLIEINFGFLISRLLQRAWFVAAVHGPAYALLSPLRAVLGNFIAFGAFWRAFRQYLGIQLRSRKIVWDKTDHRYPSAAATLRRPPDEAEILQHNGVLTHEQVQRAHTEARATGRPLGLQLLDLNLCSDADLAGAYSELFGLSVERFDPLAHPLARGLERSTAARFCAVPIRAQQDGGLTVALGEPLSPRSKRALLRVLRRQGYRHVAFVFAPLGEVALAIRCAHLERDAGHRDRNAQHYNYRRLGDRLAAAGLIDHPALQRALALAWRRGLRLGEVLAQNGAVPPISLAACLAAHEAELQALLQDAGGQSTSTG